ncbi:MAG: glutamate--tRNA ligase [Patescibacteria group bacterium]|jgi:glutamyl/glutaminyl-tRNA synthetase|nr:glutamate--tRNA ligase [Patescibacteria group bacterium]MDD5172717.1 glutamate--tRNA ligase [Patescibacteria group bacterium]
MKKNKIKVRFAPSPTGYLHIGGLRTYLYNWLFAKKNKGEIILRIEDTDRQRYVEGATESLIETLKKIGLPWDKGPFIQSQKMGNYQGLAQKLVDDGHAYYCFCSPDILEKMKQKQIADKLAPRYDRRCRNLNEEEISLRLRSGQPYVIRLKVPNQGSIKFRDLIRNDVEFDLKNIDDQILLKSDGWPTYHLANVVDDHFMGITHVIRGEEWLSSTPKHILIYRAFNWSIPEFAHLPLLLNPDHSKLSKRQGDVAAEDYLAQGYLSKTLINFLALLGWNPGNNQEIFNLKQLIKEFSLEKIQKSGAIFNREKLDWLNGYYLRQMPINKLVKLCIPYLNQLGFPINRKKIKKIIFLEQERLKRLNQIGDLANFFFLDDLEYEPGLLFWGKTSSKETEDNLIKIKFLLKKIPCFQFKAKIILKKLNILAKEKGTGEIFWPLRVCLSGQKSSPPPEAMAEIMGQEKTLKRIDLAINKIKRARQ